MTNESGASLRAQELSNHLPHLPPPGISVEQLCEAVQRQPGLAGLLIERLAHSKLGTLVDSKHMPGAVGFGPGDGLDALRFEAAPLLVVRHSDPRLGMARPCTALFTRRHYQDVLCASPYRALIDSRVDRYAEMSGGALLWQASVADPKLPVIIDAMQPHAVFLPHAAVVQCMRLWTRVKGIRDQAAASARTSGARYTTNPAAHDKLQSRITLLLRQWPEVTQAALYEHREPVARSVLTLGLCVDEVSAALQARIKQALPLIGWGLLPSFDIKLLALHTPDELDHALHGSRIYGLSPMPAPPTATAFTPITAVDPAMALSTAAAQPETAADSLVLPATRVSADVPASAPVPLAIEQLCMDVQAHPGLTGLLVERLIHTRLCTMVNVEPHDDVDHAICHDDPWIADDLTDDLVDSGLRRALRFQLVPLPDKDARCGVSRTCKALFTQARYAEQLHDANGRWPGANDRHERQGAASQMDSHMGSYVATGGAAMMRLASGTEMKRPIAIDPGQRHSVVMPCSVVAVCLRLWAHAVPAEDVPSSAAFVRFRPASDERDGLQMRIGTLLRQWPQIGQAVLYQRCEVGLPPTLTLGLVAGDVPADLAKRIRESLPLLTWGLPARFRVKRLDLHGTLQMTHSMFGPPIYDGRHAFLSAWPALCAAAGADEAAPAPSSPPTL